jgi:hypothetical protein
MGFARNYQVRILSKQINIARLTTMSIPSNKMSPWFLTGFSDAAKKKEKKE